VALDHAGSADRYIPLGTCQVAFEEHCERQSKGSWRSPAPARPAKRQIASRQIPSAKSGETRRPRLPVTFRVTFGLRAAVAASERLDFMAGTTGLEPATSPVC